MVRMVRKMQYSATKCCRQKGKVIFVLAFLLFSCVNHTLLACWPAMFNSDLDLERSSMPTELVHRQDRPVLMRKINTFDVSKKITGTKCNHEKTFRRYFFLVTYCFYVLCPSNVTRKPKRESCFYMIFTAVNKEIVQVL